VILDSIGAGYLGANLESLAHGGALVLIGLMKGAKAEIDLSTVLRRHLRIYGSTLRPRSAAEKAQIVAAFSDRFGPALKAGRLRPPIYKELPLEDAAEGHRLMQASEHFGKIVLRIS
jgi:NADPH2:quinone reductase